MVNLGNSSTSQTVVAAGRQPSPPTQDVTHVVKAWVQNLSALRSPSEGRQFERRGKLPLAKWCLSVMLQNLSAGSGDFRLR